jgi:4-alpha-glucanotransferase
MEYHRAAGILLHPTSLPGPYGIGDIGPEAYKWIDFLAESGCRLWQILPLGPTGYGDSPYQCFSAFAGNPYLISPELMLSDDLLHTDDLIEIPTFPTDEVDYGAVIPWKLGVLDRGYIRFKHSATKSIKQLFDDFIQQNKTWLDDFAVFMAIKEAFGGGPWVDWPKDLRDRSPEALESVRQTYREAINRQKFRQFIFFKQWSALRVYADSKGIIIIGDIPIFVAHDSAEVWANPDLFYLDGNGEPTVVSGVPPDYFTETGQLWGNPLYRWEVHTTQGYRWWIARIQAVLQLVDIVRLDHFRGFAGYWEVPASEKTAVHGSWKSAPGMDFFKTIQNLLGELPIIAEDLGVITPDVVLLREQFHLPGMKVIQFAFTGDPNEPFLPHNYNKNCVVYTGTHDNDTSLGWYLRVSEEERDFCRRYLGTDGNDIAWDIIRAAWSSVGVFALAPMQDFLSLGNEARMNYPGDPSGNWCWRLQGNELTKALRARIKEMNFLYSRSNQKDTENSQ